MDELITKLDLWLKTNRPDYYKHLIIGVQEDEILSLEKTLRVSLPQDFKQFLRWKNGQNNRDVLASNWSLLSSKDIRGIWEFLTEQKAENIFEIEEWWETDWIPFLDDYTGNHLCIDTKGYFGGKPGQIIGYWHDEAERSIEFPNFHQWLDTLVQALYDNKISPNDFNKFSKLKNPGFPKNFSIPFETTDS